MWVVTVVVVLRTSTSRVLSVMKQSMHVMCFALKLKRKGPLKVCMIGMQGNTCASVASKERVEETVVSALT